MRFRANRSWYVFPAWLDGRFFQAGVQGEPPVVYEGEIVDETERFLSIRVWGFVPDGVNAVPIFKEDGANRRELRWEWVREVFEVVAE